VQPLRVMTVRRLLLAILAAVLLVAAMYLVWASYQPDRQKCICRPAIGTLTPAQ
jgi:cell division protein FtsL